MADFAPIFAYPMLMFAITIFLIIIDAIFAYTAEGTLRYLAIIGIILAILIFPFGIIILIIISVLGFLYWEGALRIMALIGVVTGIIWILYWFFW